VIRAVAAMVWPEEDGYSLIELIVVMAILGVVMTGLTAVFVGGSNAEVQLNNRFRAQQEARTALDRIRGDIHCASKAQAAQAGQSTAISTYSGLRLDVTSCNASTTYDYWCVISSSTAPQRYQLYRTWSTAAPTSATCTSTDAARVLVASNLVSASAFTTNPTPPNGLQTVGVDFKVAGNLVSNTKELYELTDSVVIRNSAPSGTPPSTHCSSSSANWDIPTSTCTWTSVP
jgi:prepilin-type N-terminal cleavage/methylation domain-containing protein